MQNHNRHRGGRAWTKAKRQMQTIYGTTCIHCGHPEAYEADHLIPLAVDPHQPIDPHAIRPAHGSNYPCPICPGRNGKGRCCNQERGTRGVGTLFTPKIPW